MLKLLIVDDEKIIRETISLSIPWQDYGIEVIGTASNGMEAYDIVLDESPDIVMTDIKMPGLSGLELLEKVRKSNVDVEFIILSGYGEFDFARKAMKYGVQHYLLKPCGEEQIVSCIRETAAAIYDRRAKEGYTSGSSLQYDSLNSLLLNILNEGVSRNSTPIPDNFNDIYRHYRKFMNFEDVSYEICYLYYVDERSMNETLRIIEDYRERFYPGIRFYTVYVRETMLFFFPSFTTNYNRLDQYMKSIRLFGQSTQPVYNRDSFPNLQTLLNMLIPKIQRYGTIFFYYNDKMIPICNYRTLIQRNETQLALIYGADEATSAQAISGLIQMLKPISNILFLKQLASSIIMFSSSRCLDFSSLEATELLLEVNKKGSCDEIVTIVANKLQQLHELYFSSSVVKGTLSSTIIEYVEAHIEDSDLSLKNIAENYLYMNVDYVSKKFVQETGERFSHFLTDVRIRKAKELLATEGNERIQDIAERVGCGNNPQYFSQLFKKSTGMTPSNYVKYIAKGNQQ